MSGLPTTQILLDDGTGTYPTDVTSSVRLVEGLVSSRGRGDELADNQPGSLSLVFDNTAGLLTPSSGFGGGGFGMGPFGGGLGLVLDQGIRIKLAGLTRWTGRIQSLPTSWPSGGSEFAVVQATAVDALALMARRALRSAAMEESLRDAPVAYYPLQEPATSGPLVVTQASDLSGNDQALLFTQASTGGSSTFEAAFLAPGLADGSTCWKQTGAVGVQLPVLKSTSGSMSSTALRVTVAMQTVLSTGFATLAQVGGISLIYDSVTGMIFADGMAAGGVSIGSTATGVVTYQVDSTSADLWFNGVKLSSAVPTAFGLPPYNDALVLLGDTGTGLNTTLSTLTLAHFSYGNTRVPDSHIVTLHQAIRNDMLGETPSARVARLAGYSNVATGSLDTTGDTLCGYANQSGQAALDSLLEAEQADQGSAYADKNGSVSYISGATLAGAGTPTATLDANWFDPGTSVLADMLSVVNDVTGSTPVTGNQYRVTSAASIAQHGVYPQSYQWNVSTDAQVKDRTDWKVGNYAYPQVRVADLTLDLLTMDSTSRTAALTLDLGSYLRITGMPSQTPGPGGTQLDLIVEGLTETLQAGPSGATWVLTLNVVLRSLVGAWVLGDTTWGVLNSTTKLYF
jgi:hypothetical protein